MHRKMSITKTFRRKLSPVKTSRFFPNYKFDIRFDNMYYMHKHKR
jgi:hypothetical protein